MPNSKQAKKRLVQDEGRRQRNKAARSGMKSAVKKVIDAKDASEAEAAMPEAMKRIDKALKHNIIHENAAARTKSRVTRAKNAK